MLSGLSLGLLLGFALGFGVCTILWGLILGRNSQNKEKK